VAARAVEDDVRAEDLPGRRFVPRREELGEPPRELLVRCRHLAPPPRAGGLPGVDLHPPVARASEPSQLSGIFPPRAGLDLGTAVPCRQTPSSTHTCPSGGGSV